MEYHNFPSRGAIITDCCNHSSYSSTPLLRLLAIVLSLFVSFNLLSLLTLLPWYSLIAPRHHHHHYGFRSSKKKTRAATHEGRCRKKCLSKKNHRPELPSSLMGASVTSHNHMRSFCARTSKENKATHKLVNNKIGSAGASPTGTGSSRGPLAFLHPPMKDSLLPQTFIRLSRPTSLPSSTTSSAPVPAHCSAGSGSAAAVVPGSRNARA